MEELEKQERKKETKETLELQSSPDNFYFGMLGALLPLIVMLLITIYMVSQHILTPASISSAGFFGVVTGFLLLKEKKAFSSLVYKGLKNHVLQVIIVATLFAGILGKTYTGAGLVNALLKLILEIGFSPSLVCAAIFLIAAVISTATGTSVGTAAVVAPTLFPLAISMGCDPYLTFGAILSGCVFGDNIAPVSDMTIASSITQETSIAIVVGDRLKYSLISGIVSVGLFAYFGSKMTSGTEITADAVEGDYSALVLLLAPVAVIILTKLGYDLAFTLMTVSAGTLLISVILGLISPSQLLPADGIISSGFSGTMTIFPFLYMLNILMELMNIGGVYDWILGKTEKLANSTRKTEMIIGIISMAGFLIVNVATVNVVTWGPLIRKIGKQNDIPGYRTANLLNGMTSGMCGITPFNGVFMNAFAFIMATGAAEGMSMTGSIPYMFHCWGLLIVYWFTVLTGVMRVKKEDR